jgi:hypothetical protein
MMPDYATAEEIKRLRLALQQIAKYTIEYQQVPVNFNVNCTDCAEAARRNWPPSLLCDKHYTVRDEMDRKNRRAEALQHHAMRDIARAALAGSEEGKSKR